jgi:hypothetical protein
MKYYYHPKDDYNAEHYVVLDNNNIVIKRWTNMDVDGLYKKMDNPGNLYWQNTSPTARVIQRWYNYKTRYPVCDRPNLQELTKEEFEKRIFVIAL